MKIEHEKTFERHLREGINIFTGAGFSLLATDHDGRPLPTGATLKEELCKEFPTAPKGLDLPKTCACISRSRKNDLEEFIRQRFIVKNYDPLYENIAYINVKFIFTTNVDNLLEVIFDGNSEKFLNNIDFNGITVHERSAIDYIHLHGYVCDPESTLIFDNLSIASAPINDGTRWNFLSKSMLKYPTLFWGSSMNDTGTLCELYANKDENNTQESWIIVHPDKTSKDEIAYYKAINLNIIESSTEEFLMYLSNFSSNDQQITTAPYKSIPSALRDYTIPTNSPSLEHRALQTFYLGAAPEWGDIYNSRVKKISFFRTIEELANNKKNILITGGPATGKTTLLMQLAAFYNFNGIKLFIPSISLEKAKHIATIIENIPTLIFIDNFRGSIDALNFLAQKKNIQLIIAERDYAYLIISNANFIATNTGVVDITSIKEIDKQTIIDSIPIDLKNKKKINIEDGDSLFEIMEKNCKMSSIKERFKNVLSDLKKKDDDLVQFFLLVCYLHSCRSIASMDIIWNFLDNYWNTYDDKYSYINNLIDILSSSISEYIGPDCTESNQDYFTIRSNLLADCINYYTPAEDLAKMLQRFYNRISLSHIPRLDCFKFQAYDARLFAKAFPNIQDGIDIYDLIYKKNNSYYTLQQKALYLSHKNEHQRAFKIIDEAIVKGGSGRWSIKNSEAIIKFQAYIRRDNTSDVQDALDDSMATLKKCYSSDSRKTFHALTYANQSIAYWDKYRNDKAKIYLLTAKEWLNEEKNQNQKAKKLLAKVEHILDFG